MPFVEALRQLQLRVKRENFCLVHVSMVPTVNEEQKTKPTQHSVKGVYIHLIIQINYIYTNKYHNFQLYIKN